jgi:hypothetical protein
MVYAKKVTSPLKGGVDVELGPKTLLLGPNGSKKTAVLQALKLALVGYVDDHEGKDNVRLMAALGRLFSPSDDPGSVVLMDDGALFAWSARRKKSGGFHAVKVEKPYAVSLPFYPLQALLRSDDKTVSAWFEEQVGNAFTDAELLDLLPPSQALEGRQVLSMTGLRSPVELSTYLKNEARKLRAAATRQENTIDGIVQGVPLPLEETEKAEIRKRVIEIRAALQGADTQQQYNTLEDGVVALAEKLKEDRALLSGMPETPEVDAELLRLLRSAKESSALHLRNLGGDFCFTCMRGDADVAAALNHWTQQIESRRVELERPALERSIAANQERLNFQVEQLRSMNPINTSDLHSELETLNGLLAADRVSSSAWARANGQRKEVASDRATADVYSSLARTWKTEGQLILDRRKTSFEEAASAWLPEGDNLVMDLKACRVGFLRDGEAHTGLSGSEGNRVLLSILSATEKSSTPVILETPDRAWDPDMLSHSMQSLTQSPHQVILTSTVEPTTIPDGWTVVRFRKE